MDRLNVFTCTAEAECLISWRDAMHAFERDEAPMMPMMYNFWLGADAAKFPVSFKRDAYAKAADDIRQIALARQIMGRPRNVEISRRLAPTKRGVYAEFADHYLASKRLRELAPYLACPGLYQ